MLAATFGAKATFAEFPAFKAQRVGAHARFARETEAAFCADKIGQGFLAAHPETKGRFQTKRTVRLGGELARPRGLTGLPEAKSREVRFVPPPGRGD